MAKLSSLSTSPKCYWALTGFKPRHSCINQLTSITHKLYRGFHNKLEMWGIYLDISKAFDKVWHQGQVVLNDQCSNWVNVNAGIPQSSTPFISDIY